MRPAAVILVLSKAMFLGAAVEPDLQDIPIVLHRQSEPYTSVDVFWLNVIAIGGTAAAFFIAVTVYCCAGMHAVELPCIVYRPFVSTSTKLLRRIAAERERYEAGATQKCPTTKRAIQLKRNAKSSPKTRPKSKPRMEPMVPASDLLDSAEMAKDLVGHSTLLAMNSQRFIVVALALSLSSVFSHPIPFLGSIGTYVPGLQNAPVWNHLPKGDEESQNEMVQAGERFLSHALQLTTVHGPAKVEHVEGMIGALSDFVIHSPDFAKLVNVSLLTKEHIELLVNEQFDQLDEMLARFIKEHDRGRNVLEKITENMARAAMDLKKGNRVADVSKVLIPLEKLPKKVINQAFNGGRLWSLTKEESEAIRDYYLGVLSGAIRTDQEGAAVKTGIEPDTEFVKRLVEKMPRNIDFMEIPRDIVKKLLNGELPQFNTLPKELQEFFKTNLDFFIRALGDKINMTDAEALPTFERIELPTYEPYDLSKLENGVMKLTDEKSNNVWVFVTVFLFLLSFVSAGLLFWQCRGQPRHTIIIEDLPPQFTSTPRNSPSRRDESHDE
ncbi:hypothetical protein QR680_015240 [Steinernema hermaphroditum]|uniref:Uncharacterized protein n=1 Tax=Steinernema hermaphroditum TaxID=289476 RepID=A0AA39H975_9BILA|nr:hypothetical protein QR680_015240 [Steinernema hermaphroditum]